MQDHTHLLETDHVALISYQPSDNTSQIETSLGAIMPESYPGELFARAESLMKGTAADRFREKAAVLIFRLSNKQPQSLVYQQPREEWHGITSIVFRLGLTDSTINLPSFRDATISAFAESLFHKALYWTSQGCDAASHITIWLLKSGLSPNCIVAHPEEPMTAVELAFRHRSPRLLKILIDHGADVQRRFGGGTRTALERLMETLDRYMKPEDLSHVSEMAELLISSGVSPNSDSANGNTRPAINLACRYGDLKLVKLLVENGADITKRLTSTRGILAEVTVMTDAAGGLRKRYHASPKDTQLEVVQYLLEHLRSQTRESEVDQWISADCFIAAALALDAPVIRYLHSKSPHMSMPNAFGITPLHAVCSNILGEARLEATYTSLLCLGANASAADQGCPPPLLIASFNHHVRLCRLLIEHGADVNVHWKPADLGPRKRDAIKALFTLERTQALSSVPRTPLAASLHPVGFRDGGLRCILLLLEKSARLGGNEVYFAAENCHPSLLRLVLNAGADPNGGFHHESPLRRSLRFNSIPDDLNLKLPEIASILIDAGAHVQREDVLIVLRSGWPLLLDSFIKAAGPFTPQPSDLEDVILSGNTEMITKLLGQRSVCYSPGVLCAAVAMVHHLGDNALVKIILEARRPSLSTTRLERTAVGMSAMYSDQQLTRLLLSYLKPGQSQRATVPCELLAGADIEDWKEALLYAGNWEDPKNLDKLARHRFWDEEDYAIGSPLLVALAKGNEGALEEMLRHRYVPDQICLYLAVLKSLKMLELLTAAPSQIRKGPREFRGAPLLLAISERDIDSTHLLIKAGTDVNYVDRNMEGARSPLQAAIENDTLDIMETLLAAGADVNGGIARDGGATALQIAAGKGYMGVARRLIDLGASVNAPRARRNGRTALETAAEHGRIDMVQLLLSCGAKTEETRSSRGQFTRSIQFASREGHAVVAQLLRDWREWTEDDEGLMSTDMAGEATWLSDDSLEDSYSDSDTFTESDSDADASDNLSSQWEDGSEDSGDQVEHSEDDVGEPEGVQDIPDEEFRPQVESFLGAINAPENGRLSLEANTAHEVGFSFSLIFF